MRSELEDFKPALAILEMAAVKGRELSVGDIAVVITEYCKPSRARAKALADAAHELLNWGVELDNDRLSFIAVQVDRDATRRFRAILAAYDLAEEGGANES